MSLVLHDCQMEWLITKILATEGTPFYKWINGDASLAAMVLGNKKIAGLIVASSKIFSSYDLT